MKAIFNKEIIDDNRMILDANDRALQYGDGLFETIVVGRNQINLLDYHYSRLIEGTKVLGFYLPKYFTFQYLNACISELKSCNKLLEPVRVKVQVWRSSGGFYEPLTNASNILITIQPHEPLNSLLGNVGIATTIKNYPSPFSQFKTINALQYILGSIERQKSSYDDLIILDQDGNISELLYSNIFWIKDEVFYTPSLHTGCVQGVMRSFLIDRIVYNKIELREIEVSPDELKHADHVFATNATGIIPITGVDGIEYPIFSQLNEIIN